MRRVARSIARRTAGAGSTQAIARRAGRRRGDGVPRRRPRGPGDRAAVLRGRAGRHRRRPRRCSAILAGIATAVVHRLAAVRRRRPDQPRRVLHLDRRAAGPGRRRHPQVRRARLPGGRRPARPEHLAFDISRRPRPDAWYAALLARDVQHHPGADVLETVAWVGVRRPRARAVPAARPAGAAPGVRARRRRHARTPDPSDRGDIPDAYDPQSSLLAAACWPSPVAGLAACGDDDAGRHRRGRRPDRGRRRPTPSARSARTEARRRHGHVRGHQQGQQGHRVLRLRRRRPGDGRGREHRARA